MDSLVVGGNGFIGSSLVEELVGRGHRVRVLDAVPARRDVDWSEIDYRQGALNDGDFLEDALQGVDAVFHLASSTVPGTADANPIADVQSNLVGVLRLVESMRRKKIQRLIFFSSGGTVYGDPVSLPVTETHPLSPLSSYGIVKAGIEAYLAMYHRMGVITPLIVRPSNPYGPRQSTAGIQGVIAAFLASAMASEPVRIWGDGSNVRDYIYIDDLVSLVATAGASNFSGALNAGSGLGYSVNDIYRLVREVTASKLPVEYQPARGVDVRNIVLDIGLAQSRFAWCPKVPLREGIMRTYERLSAGAGNSPTLSG